MGRGRSMEPNLPDLPRGARLQNRMFDLPGGARLQNRMFVNSWGLVGGQFVPNNKQRELAAIARPADHPTATEHSSTQCTPGAPFPFSALWEGQHQQSRFVNSQGVHLAVFRNGDNVNRSGRGLQINTIPRFIAHGYTTVVGTRRHGSGSVPKPLKPQLWPRAPPLLTHTLPSSPETTGSLYCCVC